MEIRTFLCFFALILQIGTSSAGTHSLYDRTAGSRNAVSNGFRGASSFPCPDPETVSPCACFLTGNTHMNMDCSNVTSDQQLATIFSYPFPDTNFFTLVVVNNINIHSLSGFSNGATFEIVQFQFTAINSVEKDAFSNSTNTLRDIEFVSGSLTPSTFEMNISEYPALRSLNLMSQNFDVVPPMTSSLLSTVDLSDNRIQNISSDAFDGLTNLKGLLMRENRISTLPRGLFKLQDQGGLILHFSLNSISDVEQGAFVLPSTTDSLSLTLDFQFNNLTKLPQAVYGDVLPYIQNDKFLLAGNPLDCFCDIAWIVLSPERLAKVSTDTKCADGSLFHQLDPEYYKTFCDLTSVSPTETSDFTTSYTDSSPESTMPSTTTDTPAPSVA